MKKNRRCGGFSLKLVLRYQQTNSIPLESNLWSRCPPPCSDLDSDRAEPLKYSERNITHAYFTSSGDLSLSERENKTVRISHPARRSSNITAEKEEARPQTLRLFFLHRIDWYGRTKSQFGVWLSKNLLRNPSSHEDQFGQIP